MSSSSVVPRTRLTFGASSVAIAHASRTTYKFTQSEFQAYAAQQFAQPGMTAAEVQAAATDAIFHGAFIEAPSSAVCAIFLGAGCGFFLWFRGYAGPGPTTFGVIFAMLNIVSSARPLCALVRWTDLCESFRSFP